jgi:ribosome hibernation promoting factor
VQVEITCRHGNLRDEVRAHISEKSEKLLTYFERITAITVTADFSGDRIRMEILVNSEHKHDFVSHDEGDDALSTFDSAFHKMEQQIRKYKSKVQDHRRDVSIGDATEQVESDEE